MEIDKNQIWKDNDYRNLVELFETGVKRFAKNNLFGTKNSAGQYEWETYEEVGKLVENFRGGLASIGVSEGDNVGIISDNRTEWLVSEMATFGLLGKFIPMYEKELFSVWKYIIKDAEINYLIVSKEEIFEKVKGLVDEIPTLKKIIIIEGDSDNSMKKLQEIGEKNPIPSKHPEPKDIAVLIYTSGTTGDPKGVLLSHGNLCFASQAGYHFYKEDLTEDGVSFSHLPWAHSYAISAELHNVFQFGGSMGFMDTLDTMGEDLQKVKPNAIMSVPRVFNKIYDGIYRVMKEEGGIKLKLFNMAVEAAKTKFLTGKSGFKYKVLDKIVLDKIREKFGGRLKFALTASAKMNEGIALFFYSIGIPTYDAYGLTETSPVITMNGPNGFKFGSVGKPVESTKIVIDKSVTDDDRDDGEIVVYGPQVMQGYHNKPEATKSILQDDGGIRTGDTGKIDEEGFLFITGRIKEQYKLQNGKYIFPASIEEDIKLLPYVANAMVYGDGKEYNICIVVPDFDNIKNWANEMDIQMEPQALISGIAKSGMSLRKLICDEINKHLLKKYPKYEVPKKYTFISEDFSVENGMLTQTMKVKRRAIVAKYQKDIDMLYQLD